MAPLALYIIGAIMAAGFIGGVRDEMDGIADIAIIIFWPIALIGYIIHKICCFFYGIGQFFRKKSIK